jgi:enoyl-CoA hydratase/carnithine racemase
MPAALFGLPLYLGALRRYVQAFGIARAKHLVLTGKYLSSSELLEAGLLCELVAEESLADRALELAQSVAGMPPGPLQAMKRSINAIADHSVDDDDLRLSLDQAFDGPGIAQLINAAFKRGRLRQ